MLRSLAEDCVPRIAVVTAHEPQDVRPPISFDLVTRVAVGNRLAIVLHLFREGIRILTKTVDTVGSQDAAHVLARCRESLERRGISQFEDDLAFAPVKRRAVGGR